MICVKCGRVLRDDDLFCSKCGKKIRPLKNANAVGFIGSPGAGRIYTIMTLTLYGIAILTCFICNLTVSHTLSWFFIVVSACALAFCVTPLPAMLKKHKIIISALCATGMLFVLLFTCNLVERGGWFLYIACPIAALSLLFAWGILLICLSRHMRWPMKSALIVLIAGVATLTINPYCDYLLGQSVNWQNALNPLYWTLDTVGNKIMAIACFGYFAAAAIVILCRRKGK